jgi:hypothetical protein
VVEPVQMTAGRLLPVAAWKHRGSPAQRKRRDRGSPRQAHGHRTAQRLSTARTVVPNGPRLPNMATTSLRLVGHSAGLRGLAECRDTVYGNALLGRNYSAGRCATICISTMRAS